MKTRPKTKKQALKAMMTIALLCAICTAFASCNLVAGDTLKNGAPPLASDEKSVKVIIGDDVYVQTTKCATLDALLEEMKNDGTIGAYSTDEFNGHKYVNACGKLKETDGVNGVWVYHDLTDDTLYTSNRFKVVDGVTYRSSLVGVDEIPVSANAHYLLLLEEL